MTAPANKRLTVALPVGVWDRLKAEADAKDTSIGTLARDLIVARDTRMHKQGQGEGEDQ